MRTVLLAAAGASAIVACAATAQRGISPRPPTLYTYDVVAAYPHDPDAYTQGLIFRNGALYESTGLNGRSSLRKVRLETGEVLQQARVPREYFAEGLTEWKGELFQLTWQSRVVFVYGLADLARKRTLDYAGEGWGLANDGQQLILSDGTEFLRFIDPTTFREVRRVAVRENDRPIRDLNELEFVDGEVFANVWHTDRIARIAPATGQVTGWIDLKGLLASGYRLDPEAVLNGIAYDAAGKRLFVTGKLWPKLFEIRVRRK